MVKGKTTKKTAQSAQTKAAPKAAAKTTNTVETTVPRNFQYVSGCPNSRIL